MSAKLPRHALESLDRDGLLALDNHNFFIADAEVDVACRLKLLPGADRLFIMLNGAVDRAKPLPVFARWNWGKVLGGHVLAVCDPTLWLDPQLRLGWFVGNRKIDPMQALLRTVEGVRERLGIADHRVVFYGSSGGGYASMVAAASRPCGRAIVVNPQTDILHYPVKAVVRAAKVFAPSWTPQQCSARYPLRWSALAAIAEAGRLQHDLRIVYAQNLDDTEHHAKHFLPFCAATGAPAEGGLSPDGRFRTLVYSSPEGHGAEPPEIVKFFASDGLAHLGA